MTVVILSVAFFAYFGRVLSKPQMALYAFMGTLLSWVGLLAGLGMATLAIRDTPSLMAQGRHQEARELISSTFAYVAVIALLMTGGIVLLTPFLSRQVFGSNEYAGTLRLIACVAWIQFVTQVLSLIQWALQRFHMNAVCNVLNAVGMRLLAAVGYALLGMTGFILGCGLTALLVVGVQMWNLRGEFTSRLIPLRALLKRSRVYILVDVFQNLLMNLDRPVIGFLLGDVALAEFFVGKRLYSFCQTSLVAVTAPLGAKISEAKESGPMALTSYFRKSLYLVAILFIPAGFAMLGMGDRVLALMVGPKYADSGPIVLLFGITLMAQCTYEIWREGVYRLLPGRYMTFLNGAIVVVTFGLYPVLLPWLGSRGIPLASALAWAGGAAFAAWALRTRVGLACRADLYVRPLACGAMVLAAIWAASFLGESLLAFAAMVAAAAAAYAAGFILLAPSEVRSLAARFVRHVVGPRVIEES